MTDKHTLIVSTLGFNFNIELKDINNKILLNGIKSTYYTYSDEVPSIGTRLSNRAWFTNYNQDLLNKIRDLRRLND